MSFDELAAFGERTHQDKEFNELSLSRGSAHTLYLNCPYFGLYHLFGNLGATIQANLPDYRKFKAA